MARSLKICYVASEVHPFVKSGGLADVSGALPCALEESGHDVRVFLPHYSRLIHPPSPLEPIPVEWRLNVGSEIRNGRLFHTRFRDRVPVYFIDNDQFFGRAGLYSEEGQDYGDNAERFIFFCRSVLEACKALNFRPDVIHCSDWQTGLIPVYLRTVNASDSFFRKTRTVFSIHNLGYQGNFPSECLPLAHLPWELFHPGGVEFYGDFNFLKSALMYSDLLTTVSKTYSKEIQTPEHGFGMDGVLRWRQKDLFGITNGIDDQEWNPETDRHLARTYNPQSMVGKKECKLALAEQLDLKIDLDIPMIGLVTRLSHQKGMDLLSQGLSEILGGNATLAMLGSGDPHYEKFFLDQVGNHPQTYSCRIGFDEPLAHQIIAGSDILLMPSLYEPCGLTQMYALRYGTVPVVRSIGGLRDTVKPFRPASGQGTGFIFRPYELKYFLKSVRQALSLFSNTSAWRRLALNGMAQDNGWNKAAKQYVRIYRKVIRKPPRFV